MRSTAWLLAAGLCCVASACRLQPEPDTSPPAGPAAETFAYAEADIADLQAAMARGETSSHALVQAYLARIVALDRNGPRLNAYLES